jgi:predicted secreted protein
MSITTAIAIFFITWWIVLFAVLPWGVRSQHEGGEVSPGTEPGAPMLPNLGWKLMMTTLVTGVLFAIFYVIYVYRLITLDDLAAWLPFA